jgi:hypothetical protein
MFVIIESPFKAETKVQQEIHIQYARKAIRHSLNKGEFPFASHLLYTQPGIFNDEIIEERELGINANLEIIKRADLVAIYSDYGISEGMLKAIAHCVAYGIPMVSRYIGFIHG